MADVRLTATNPADSSVVPVACNEKGELKLEEIPDQSFDGNLQGDLTVSGIASFANGDVNIDSSGRLLVGTSSSPSSGNGQYAKLAVQGSTFSAIGAAIFNLQSGKAATSLGSAEDLGFIQFTDNAGNDFAWIRGTVNGTPGAGDYPGALTFSTTANGESAPTERMRIESNGKATFAGDVVIGSRGSQWMIVESGGLAHLIQQTSFKGQPRNDGYPQLRNIPNELTMVEHALGEVMEKLRMIPPAGWEVWDGSSENS